MKSIYRIDPLLDHARLSFSLVQMVHNPLKKVKSVFKCIWKAIKAPGQWCRCSESSADGHTTHIAPESRSNPLQQVNKLPFELFNAPLFVSGLLCPAHASELMCMAELTMQWQSNNPSRQTNLSHLAAPRAAASAMSTPCSTYDAQLPPPLPRPTVPSHQFHPSRRPTSYSLCRPARPSCSPILVV